MKDFELHSAISRLDLTTKKESEHAGTFVKALSLLKIERARELGLAAESPVFVSPVTDREHFCKECNRSYAPLVYQVGYTTTAHHIHETSGGIYMQKIDKDHPVDDMITTPHFWLAQVIPHGKLFVDTSPVSKAARAQSVTVLGITAFSAKHNQWSGDWDDYQPLQEGYLIGTGDTLRPISYNDPEQEIVSPCGEFVVQNNQIFFTQYKA